MDEIHVKVVSRPKPGREADAYAVAARMTEHCRRTPGVLHYAFFADAAGRLVCLERFRDSQAFLEHIPRNEYAAAFVDACDVESTELFGAPSPELRAIMDGMGTIYHAPLGGADDAAA